MMLWLLYSCASCCQYSTQHMSIKKQIDGSRKCNLLSCFSVCQSHVQTSGEMGDMPCEVSAWHKLYAKSLSPRKQQQQQQQQHYMWKGCWEFDVMDQRIAFGSSLSIMLWLLHSCASCGQYSTAQMRIKKQIGRWRYAIFSALLLFLGAHMQLRVQTSGEMACMSTAFSAWHQVCA